MTYRIVDAYDQLDAWLENDDNESVRTAMLEWWAKLAGDPTSVEGTPIPNWLDLPAWTTVIPELDVRVSWAVLTSPPFARELESVVVLQVG